MDHRIVAAAQAIEERISSVVLGKPAQVRLATAALIAGEHLLLNDLPGVGKTTLGACLARSLDGLFGRIQGTPDLLPTDLTGSSIFDQVTGTWTFHPGPLLANVVLVDEVSRITPRTQSALLQAMAEGAITVEGETRPVLRPFMVVATMNPIGSAGTFPLTVGQLDRFGLALGLGPADRDVERRILRGEGGMDAINRMRPVLPAALLPDLQRAVAQATTAGPILDYALEICEQLRPLGHLSTRAPRSLVATARALAVLDGRGYVVPDDIKTLAVPCLAHRLAAEGEPIDLHQATVRSAVEALPVPDQIR